MVRVLRSAKLVVVLLAGASLAACASVQPRYPSRAGGPPPAAPGVGGYKVGQPYQVGGIWYVPREQPGYDQTGVASWYGDEFHQKVTANGEAFDMNAVSGAHTTLPLPSMVEVTNLENGRKLLVRVNDRGPFVGDRIIDLSHEAARQLGYDRAGLAKVRVRYVGPAPLLGPAAGVRYAQARPLPTRLPPAVAAPLPAAAPAPPPAAASRAGDDAPIVLADATPAPPPEPVAAQDLPPITGAAISDTPIPPAPAATAAAPAPTAAPGAASLRIQAGAFASEANARRAVSLLAPAGAASIEPLQHDGQTLYRVLLPAPADEAAAYALRDRIAGIGFTEARVVRAF